MRQIIIVAIFILTSNLAIAQNTEVSSKSITEGTQTKIGQLITILPSGAKLYKNRYADAKELFENIKNFFKGKAILFDIWAVWCSPCIEKMTDVKELYVKTKNLPIEFIYICTAYGTDIDKWISKVDTLKLPGTHIFVENNTLNYMYRLFPIAPSFPAYAFIDKNGKFRPEVISLDSFPTVNKLREYLK